ncbi:MAG: LamG domain-containing protein, partial [Proteobacteria bacterium]|nr:LamG domain-containing protein [Pseudomonadota bacterium]
MSAKIQFKRGTKADLHAVNPILMRGEAAIEIDTSKVKYGDGVTAWRDLPYGRVDLVDGGVVPSAGVTTTIKLRRGTAADLHEANPVLASGEPALETDTNKFKYGDGVTYWRDLPYATFDEVDGGELYPVPPGETEAFTPPNLSGLSLWLDGGDSNYISIVNNRVSQWSDKSPNRRHFFQSSKASRPANTNTVNDLGVVTFDGDNDAMLSSFTLGSEFTLFVVLNSRGNSSDGRVFTALNHATDTDPAGFIPCITEDGTSVGVRVGSEYLGMQDIIAFAPALYGVSCSSESFTTRLNGLNPVTLENSLEDSFTDFALGSSRGNYASGAFYGDVAEVVLYDRVLSDEERQQVEAYLLGRWGIAQVVHPLLDGMVAFWTMNEDGGDRLDISGGNALSETGSVNRTSGVVGYAADFGGDENYLMNQTVTLSQSFTVSGWFRSPTTTGLFVEFMKNWDGSEGQFDLAWGDDPNSDGMNELVAYIMTVGGPVRLSYPDLVADEWRHFVLSLDASAGMAHLYVDNTLADSALVSSALESTNNDLSVGSTVVVDPDSSAAFSLDSVGIWNRSLSESEIAMLWNGGFGRETFDVDLYGENVSLLLHMNKLPNVASAVNNWDKVSLLLHFDGTDGSATFTDSSLNALTVTASGDATISTAQSKFGGASASFSGGGYLSGEFPDFDFSGDFTIEMWVYLNNTDTSQCIMQIGNIGEDGNGGMEIFFHEGGLVFNNAVDSAVGPVVVSAEEWIHVACVRNIGVNTLYVNGVNSGSASFSFPIQNGLFFAGWAGPSYGQFLNGYIDELRITKGVARYTENFTPPTAPFTEGPDPAVSDSSLLLHFDGNLNDSSPNNIQVTANGNATTSTAQSKFGGASLFVDNENQDFSCVSAASDASLSPGSGDYTIEGWVYPTNTDGPRAIFSKNGGDDNNEFVVYVFNGLSYIVCTYSGTNWTNDGGFGSESIPENTWSHVAMVKGGSTVSVYVNGILSQQTTISTIAEGSAPLRIGAEGNIGQSFVGYIDEVRIIKGTAVYTENFTPPEFPFGMSYSPITYFYDSGPNNHEVTAVGDARISINRFKYGNASGVFRVDGDHIELPSAAGDLGADDFTVEFWCYPLSFSSYTTIAGNLLSNNDAEWQIICDGTPGNLTWYRPTTPAGGIFLNIAAELQTNIWQHVAFVRSSGSMTLYVDGVAAGSVADTFDYSNPTNALWIGHTPENLSGRNFDGHIDDFRITKGVARYTSNFTPPAMELPDPVKSETMAADPYAEDVVLLLHMDGADGSTTFIDNSFACNTVTANGNA